MSIVVEHDKRRHEILEKALDAFMEEGYEEVTLQKIAGRCGITRTTLYTYFKNKREIFNFSVKQFLEVLENDITLVKNDNVLSCTDKIIKIMTVILDRLEENKRILSVVLNYLVYIFKSDPELSERAQGDVSRVPAYRFRRRTVRLRHILTTILIEGIKAGEFSKSINVKETNEMLYSFIEAAIFHMVVLRSSPDELKKGMGLALRLLSKAP